MKKVFLLLLAIGIFLPVLAQLNPQLLKPDEELVFTFLLKNKKRVTVAMEKDGQYIVYRFGLPAKLELEYPKNPGESSWQLFSFRGYNRGGGKANAAMSYAFLTFTNNGIDYEVYDTWDSEEDAVHCGVTVTIKGKTTDLPGLVKTRKGYLLNLSDNEKIKKEE
ncbi:MAG: hypothetical protein U0X40_11630 [Ferruginibacter sp.]